MGVSVTPKGVRNNISELRLTEASKVREWPMQSNGFALPAIREICTYATPTCWAGCYAKKGRLGFSACKRNYAHNYATLLQAGTVKAMADLLLFGLSRVRFNIFRIHVSGEFYSVDYAKAWAIACREYPEAQFWCYTHSQDVGVLRVLTRIKNLQTFLSCDRDNWQKMLALSRRFPRFGLAYYSVGETPADELYTRAAQTHRGGLIVFPDKKVRKRSRIPGTCPTERAKDPMSKNEACALCRRCLGGKNGG